MKSILLILFFGVFVSCCSTKVNKDANYTSGTIAYSEVEDDCMYTIRVVNEDESSLFLDPINLEDAYKKDGLKIKFQYRPLKMKNRCNKANPISISYISSL